MAQVKIVPKDGVIIGIALIIVGAVITGWKASRIQTEVASYQWSQTTGILESAKFSSEVRTGRSGAGGTTTTRVFYGDFSYEYEVEGQKLKGSRYDLSGRLHTGRESHAQKLESRLTTGESVPVYYNPDNPTDSILNRGISEDTSVRLVFTSFLLGTGIFVTRHNLKRQAEQGAA